MGKREDNKLAKQLEREIINGISGRLKGSGWKKKNGSYFRSINNNFYCAHAYPYFVFENSIPSMFVRGRYEAKPMGIDPIYWNIAQMPDNKNEPLSFRAWAAFKTESAVFHFDTTIGKPSKTVDDVIGSFPKWMIEETERASLIMESQPFSEVYKSTRNETVARDSFAETMICSLILEDRVDEALTIARQFAPNEYRNLFLNGDPDDRVNFFELSILHLAGEEIFRKEVQTKSGLGLLKRLTRKFW